MTFLVFTFVFVMGNVFREVLSMLVNGQASLGTALNAAALLVPFAVGYAMPMAVLTAVLLVFGRFSADLELTAARAGGVSLVSLAAPVIVFSLCLCGLSAWVNLQLAPSSRAAYKQLVFKFTREFSVAHIPEGRHIKDIPGYIVYIGKNRNGNLEDVLVYVLGEGTNQPMSWFAPRGSIELDTKGTNRLAVLNLFDARGVALQGDPISVERFQLTYDLSQLDQSRGTSIGNMTFTQLRTELQNIKKRVMSESTDATDPAGQHFIAAQIARLSSPVKVELHQQWAFSFACFGFTLIGIPLGIRVQRRETNIGFALAVVLVMVYYSLIMLGLSLENYPKYYPHLLLWIPNLVFQTVGGWLLWRANRGG